MTELGRQRNEPEVVGIFDEPDALFAAIDELRMHGFSRADICVLADEKSVEDKLHKHFWRATELADNPDAPRGTYFSEEDIGAAEGALISVPLYVFAVVTAGLLVTPAGALLPAFVGATAAGAAGAGLGGLLAWLVGRHHAEHLHEQVQHGGLLLWARTSDREMEKRAIEIMKTCGGRAVHRHGWTVVD